MKLDAQDKTLTGILCTFDKIRRGAEDMTLIACANEDVQIIRSFNDETPTCFIPNQPTDQ
jgi:hypothetical protein